jgi:DNA-nicking Smr family endonuclease
MQGQKRQARARLQHQPFRALRHLLPAARPKRAAPAPPPRPPADLSEEHLFRREMTGVRRLTADAAPRVPDAPRTPPPRPVSPEAEALAALAEFTAGDGPFDLADTTEYVEGAAVGLDPRVVRRLRRGEFSSQHHIDLHGLTTAEARAALERFLTEASQRGHRCVLIVHGRGRNSKDQIPVLKREVAAWLARGPRARLVLAFTSARPCDGGVGALYVLLRRDRRTKRPIRVTEGAKW